MVQTKKGAERFFSEQSPVYFQKKYRTRDRYPTLLIRHRYILQMIDSKSGVALDVGCGSSPMLIELPRIGFETIGTDISSPMIRSAIELISETCDRPMLCVSDIEHLPFVDDAFDVIVCSGVIEYLDQDGLAIREVSRLLKPKGTAIVTFTNALAPFWLLETYAKAFGIFGRFASFRDVPFPKSRLSVPYAIRGLAQKVGLIETDRAYFDFSILPFPLNALLPRLSRNIGMKMERLSRSKIGFIGRGCIIKFAKKG